MAEIDTLNIGGIDYAIKDSVARSSSGAANLIAYTENGTTASQAYSVIGTPINWKGTLYYTKTAVAKGDTWAVNTNLKVAGNLGRLTRNIDLYVGSDGKLHFTDLTGADTVLNFSSGGGGRFAAYFSEQSYQETDIDRILQWYFDGTYGTFSQKYQQALHTADVLECPICKFGWNDSGVNQQFVTAKVPCKVYNAANTLLATLAAGETGYIGVWGTTGKAFYVVES